MNEASLHMFRTVLVPLDGSPLAEQALPWALSIARRAGATLDLVRGHALYASNEPVAAWGPYDPHYEDECQQLEQLYLDSTARWLSSVSPVPTCTTLLRDVPGLEGERILERIRTARPDLVVMTTHGRGRVGRFFLGSMADELVRQSGVPVLVLHPQSTVPGLLPEPVVESILVPLDGSALAEQVLKPAVNLARLLDARCSLLRVVEPPPPSPGGAKLAPAGAQPPEAQAYLERLAGPLRERGLQVQTRVVVSRHPDEAILEEARTCGNGLIALATHGRGGISRLLLGSVADTLIRGATCPVLVYRPKEP
jgi:nucleotide-binding universal stress UspA family protein